MTGCLYCDADPSKSAPVLYVLRPNGTMVASGPQNHPFVHFPSWPKLDSRLLSSWAISWETDGARFLTLTEKLQFVN